MKVANLFNSNDEQLDELFGGPESVRYWTGEGLDPTNESNYYLTPDKARETFRDYRGELMGVMQKYRRSGNGDGTTVSMNAHCDLLSTFAQLWLLLSHSSACSHVHVTYQISVEDSLTIQSSVFRSYCDGRPLMDFLYELFISEGILESASKDMPPDAASSSSKPGSASSLLSPPVSGSSEKASVISKIGQMIDGINGPPPSPEAKAVAKRKRKAEKDLAETKSKGAMLDLVEKLLESIEASKARLETLNFAMWSEQRDDDIAREKKRLRNLNKKLDKEEKKMEVSTSDEDGE